VALCFAYCHIALKPEVVSRVAKGKYQKWLTPDGLTLMQAWARDGLTDEQIAHNIGITTSTLYDWKNKHPEISEALKKGKEIVDVEVENALLRKAKGYNAQVQKTFKVKEVYYDENGHRCEKEHLETAIDEVHVPADTTAQIFWLKNRMPDKWRVNPSNEDNNTGQLEELLKGMKTNE
jgi:DNA-binding XRE family transcriptional regulator